MNHEKICLNREMLRLEPKPSDLSAYNPGIWEAEAEEPQI